MKENILLTEKLLPIQHPLNYNPAVKDPLFFYKNVAKPLIPVFIEIMKTGIKLDITQIENLESTILNVLDKVKQTLANNNIIKKFLVHRNIMIKKQLLEKFKKQLKTEKDFNVNFKIENIKHRTLLVNNILKSINKTELIKEKWSIADLKKLNKDLKNEKIDRIINKTLSSQDDSVLITILEISKDKAKKYNKRKMQTFKNHCNKIDKTFNPGSAKQKQEFFKWLKIEPIKVSKITGEPSWDRVSIETVKKMTPGENKDLHEILQAFIDYSYADIIKNNFIKAFKSYSVNNVLHGNIKLLGAKSARPTSNKPNLLNAPSTGSVYAKTFKKIFKAPKGYRVWSIDYSALEDRIIANLSGDRNKLGVFLDNLDGHSLAACFYKPEEAKRITGLDTNDTVALSKALKKLVDEKNPEAKALRQKHKSDTFKLAYGGFPDADKGGTITQEIFDAYHYKLYPGITAFRNRVIKYTKECGYNHLGLGFMIWSDNIRKEERTVFNASSQFWGILTLMSIHDLKIKLKEFNLEKEIIINSTIYDSIYGYIKDDVDIIKWLNDTLPPIMETDWLENIIVSNEANLEVSSLNNNTWSGLHELKHNMTKQEINDFLNSIN